MSYRNTIQTSNLWGSAASHFSACAFVLTAALSQAWEPERWGCLSVIPSISCKSLYKGSRSRKTEALLHYCWVVESLISFCLRWAHLGCIFPTSFQTFASLTSAQAPASPSVPSAPLPLSQRGCSSSTTLQCPQHWGCEGRGCCPSWVACSCVMQGVFCFDTHVYKEINSLNERARLLRQRLEWPKW